MVQSGFESVLRLDDLYFDTIRFTCGGVRNKSQLSLSFRSEISKHVSEESYRVRLIAEGKKEDEYEFEIGLIGIFSFDSDSSIDEKTRGDLISKNAISILMPFLRSEITLLTSQPGMSSIVLPPFDITRMFEQQ